MQGAKQTGGVIELEVIREASQSYITKLWNNEVFSSNQNEEKSCTFPWSRYFTLALFSIALGALVYWWIRYHPDTSGGECGADCSLPCSLLLSATFTYGNMLRIFGNKLYLKNASVIGRWPG